MTAASAGYSIVRPSVRADAGYQVVGPLRTADASVTPSSSRTGTDDLASREREMNLTAVLAANERLFAEGKIGHPCFDRAIRREALSTATHEAGHACVAVFYGARLTRVTVIPGGNTNGRCAADLWGAVFKSDRSRLMALGAFAYGGAAAHHERFGSYGYAHGAGCSDLTAARAAAAEAAPNDAAAQERFCGDALARAHRVFEDRSWRLASRDLAMALLCAGEMDGPAATARILRVIDPAHAEFIQTTAEHRDARWQASCARRGGR